MDHQKIAQIIQPVITDNRNEIKKSINELSKIRPETNVEQQILLVLKSIIQNIEIAENLKNTARNIIKNNAYFSSLKIDDKDKLASLQKVLESNHYLQNSKLFSINLIQTYLDTFVSSKLHEINIKIEENQRFLHQMIRSNTGEEHQGQTITSSSKYILAEVGNKQFAIASANLVELLKLKTGSARSQAFKHNISYKKLRGFFGKNILKKINPSQVDSRSTLQNLNLNLGLDSKPDFAIIINNQNVLAVLFAKNLINIDPIEAKKTGDYVETTDGVYETIGF